MRGRVEIRQETEIGKFIVLLPKKIGKCIKIRSQFTVRRLSSNSMNVLNSLQYF